MSISMWPTYEVIELRSMREVKECFPSNQADQLNWCFVGTSGVHGTYTTLDTVEAILRGKNGESKALSNGKYPVTIMILHPRLCVLKYGEINVGLKDISLLRELVESTIEAIIESQQGNLTKSAIKGGFD